MTTLAPLPPGLPPTPPSPHRNLPGSHPARAAAAAHDALLASLLACGVPAVDLAAAASPPTTPAAVRQRAARARARSADPPAAYPAPAPAHRPGALRLPPAPAPGGRAVDALPPAPRYVLRPAPGRLNRITAEPLPPGRADPPPPPPTTLAAWIYSAPRSPRAVTVTAAELAAAPLRPLPRRDGGLG